MPSDWFDQNQQIWAPPQQPQGQPGAGIEQGATPPVAPRPAFDLGDAQIHGRTGDPKDPNDLLWLASQQPGFDFSSNDAAKKTFSTIIQPMFQQYQGVNTTLGGKNFDRVVMPGGRTLDFIGSAGEADTSKRRFWVGDSAHPGPSAAAPMTLGGLGQMPVSPDLYRPPTGAPPLPDAAAGPQAMMGGIDPQQAAQQQEQDLRAMAATKQAPYAPQTVQGPAPMALRIPGFASGVQNFGGGPAVVGERGPELVNLPAGSDVIPFGSGAQTPAIGTSSVNFGGGAGIPAVGTVGGSMPVNFGNDGGLPAIGTVGGGAPVNFGGGNGAFNQPRELGGQPGQQSTGGGYAYNPMAGPQNYNPQQLQGPDRLTLGSIAQPGNVYANQVGLGQQVTAGWAQTGGPVSYDRVTGQTVATPAQIAAERIQGPAALQAAQLQNPGQFNNLSLSQFQQDPSYQFDKSEQLGAIQNSAAAKGGLHNPNTIRALQETASNLANRQYDTVNARNLALQQQNFGNQATVAGANNAANAQAYGLTNQFQQQAALANQATGLEANKFNVSTGLQAGMFNAQQQQQAALANQSAGLQSGMFNSGQQQQVNLANIGNQLQAGQFNSAQGQQAALANQGANLNAGQFNANQNFQTQQANLQNQLAAYNAYQPLQQQNQQFNAAQQSAAAQNNFANQFSVNQANNAGSLGAFNANLGAELGRGNLALGQTQAANSYNLGQGNLALGNRSADQSYDLGLRNNALGYYGAQNSYNLGLGNLGVSQGQLGLAQQGQNYNQDLSTFNTNYGVYRDNRDTAFNQGTTLAGIGAGAAGNYGNQAGALYSGQGNANGAAGMAGAGAWAGALGNLGNIAGQAGAYYANPGNQQQATWAGPGPAPWVGSNG